MQGVHVRKSVATIEDTECCAQVLAAPLSEVEAEQLALGFKALADPVRLRLLSLIADAPDGTACSCDLEGPVGKTQSTVSHHLALLAVDAIAIVVDVDKIVVGADLLDLSERFEQRLMIPEPHVVDRAAIGFDVLAGHRALAHRND